MTTNNPQSSALLPSGNVLGVDIGGTKCAAGIVSLPGGNVLTKRWHPTRPQRGGETVLNDVVSTIRELQQAARDHGWDEPRCVGIGVAELVNPQGEILSDATIRWKGLQVQQLVRDQLQLPTTIDADVRAAARAEAFLGAGRQRASFLYVTVGTGISASMVWNGKPLLAARGLTGTFASSRGLIPSDAGTLVGGPPLEQFAAGPALAARYAEQRPGFVGRAEDVCTRAEAGDEVACDILMSSGRALGAAIGQLVNVLDPEAVIVGGGLGLASGRYWDAMERSLRTYVWSDYHRDIALLKAELGPDAGWIGAAIGGALVIHEATSI
jgi:glucokinase